MFNDNIFEDWLNSKSKELATRILNKEVLSNKEMIIAILKTQSNQCHHTSTNTREFRHDIQTDMKEFREDMNTKFEQTDIKFYSLMFRMDRFMIWSLGLTMTSTFIILGFMYKVVGN